MTRRGRLREDSAVAGKTASTGEVASDGAASPDSVGRVDVSVLVPVLNEESRIRDVVETMRSQRFPGKLEFLFMDGQSEDRTRDILEELGSQDRRIRVLDNPARSTPHGLNIGLRRARGDFIARMDGHSYYPPGYLAQGVERLRRGDVEWVTGPQLPWGNGKWSRRVALALQSPLGTGASKKWAASVETELDTGVFTGIWHRATLEAHGGWDEGFPANQDSELAARILQTGGRIVCVPELGARYVPRDSLQGLGRQYLRYGFYRAKTSRLHPESMRRSHLLSPGLVLMLVTSIASPRQLRGISRAGLAFYTLALTAAGIRTIRRGAGGDGAALPAVFATMHLSWGLGFLAGCVRFGPPLRALGRAAGLHHAPARAASVTTGARGVEPA